MKLKGDLGPLERAVMEFVWSSGPDEVTVRQVLSSTAGRGLAYTTVMTVLERLWRKGFLARKLEGRAYLYRARRTREEHVASLVREALGRTGDRREVLLSFVRSVREEDIDELRRVIREVERERRSR